MPILRRLLLAVVLAASVSLGASLTAPLEAADFFPLIPGTSYQYQNFDFVSTAKILTSMKEHVEVKPPVSFGGRQCYPVNRKAWYSDGRINNDVTILYAAGEAGAVWQIVADLAGGNYQPRPTPWPVWLPLSPEQNRDEPSETVSDGGKKIWSRRTINEFVALGETITVPAGTFQGCLHIRRRFATWPSKGSGSSSSSISELWYAPGVGLVRQELTQYKNVNWTDKNYSYNQKLMSYMIPK